MNGAMYRVSGTSAAVVPIEVPTIERVNGEIATSKMMNGRERMMLTTTLSTPYTSRFGRRPPGRVITSASASGMPTRAPMNSATPTMYTVSPKESRYIDGVTREPVRSRHQEFSGSIYASTSFTVTPSREDSHATAPSASPPCRPTMVVPTVVFASSVLDDASSRASTPNLPTSCVNTS